MPANVVNKMVDILGMSKKEAEDLWNAAKKASDEYKDVPKDSNRYYSITMGILKKMLGNEKTKKLGWESKAEQLIKLVDSLQGDSNIAIRAAHRLDKAIDEKNTDFFIDMFKDVIEDMFYNRKTEADIYNILREKIVRSLQAQGFGLTQEKITNLKEVISDMISKVKSSLKDLKDYSKE